MFIAIRLLSILFVVLTIGAAIATFSAGVTNDWIVMDAHSAANQTIAFGMTSFCVGSNCRAFDYTAPIGCARTKWEVLSRMRAVEAFVLIHTILCLVAGLGTVFTTIGMSDNAYQRDRCREEGMHVTTSKLEQQKATEAWVRKRLLVGVVVVGVALFCIVLSTALFVSVKNGFVFCETVCSYYTTQLGVAACGVGHTFAMAVAGLVLTIVAFVLGLLLLALYLRQYPAFFTGIMTRDEPFRPVVPRRRTLQQDGQMDGVFDPDDTFSSEWNGKGPQREWSTASASTSQRPPGAVQHRNSRQEVQDALRMLQDPAEREAEGSRPRSNSAAPPLPAPKSTPKRQATPPVRHTPQRQRQTTPVNDGAGAGSSTAASSKVARSEEPRGTSEQKSSPAAATTQKAAAEDRQSEKARNPLENVQVSPEEARPERYVLQEHAELIANLEGDDWEYVDSSQLYWSGKERLYFDPASLNFYDPETDQWYDPDTGEWYALVDQS